MIQDDFTSQIISIAYSVHKELGHGFSEKIYENSFKIALNEAGIQSLQQHPIKVAFHGHLVGEFYADLYLENQLIIELKALETLKSEHHSQLINYLKASDIKTGLLINFGSPKLQIKRAYHPSQNR